MTVRSASDIPLAALGTNLAIIGVPFVASIVVGTWLFVRAERNR